MQSIKSARFNLPDVVELLCKLALPVLLDHCWVGDDHSAVLAQVAVLVETTLTDDHKRLITLTIAVSAELTDVIVVSIGHAK